MNRFGSPVNGQGMLGKLTGGASIRDPNATFNIGRRDLEAIRETLSRLGIRILAEDVGGSISRTVFVAVSTGTVTLSSPGRPDWNI